ncbi:MAG: hypothetical protein ABW104_21250 [Candidatus Thiodiazotropha sp. 6PLUC2]
MIKVKRSNRLAILLSLLLCLLVILIVTDSSREQIYSPLVTNQITKKIIKSDSTPNDHNKVISEKQINSENVVVQKEYDYRSSVLKKLLEFDDVAKLDEEFFKSELLTSRKGLSDKLSEWEVEESKNHLSQLGGSQYDVIVLPLQQKLPYYDRVGRVMSARWVANEIEMQAGMRVMSPELALRALGERRRRFDIDAVNGLAQKIDASVIYLYLDNSSSSMGKKEIDLLVVKSNKQGKITNKFILDLQQTSLENPLENVVKNRSQKIVSELFAKDLNKVVNNKPNHQFVDNKQLLSKSLPESLDELVEKLISPMEHAAYMQLFALMTPSVLRYERDRLFERSLMALSEVDPSSEEYNLLKSRALFHLTRKPVALGGLSDAVKPEEMALKAYLDGNYLDLKQYTQDIDSPLLQLMSYFELKEIQYAYSIEEDQDVVVKNSPKPWSGLISGVARDNDVWYAPDNTLFLSDLKGLYRKFDIYYERQLNAQVMSGELNIDQISNDVVGKILHKRLENTVKDECCLNYNEKLQNSDLWNFYRNHLLANILRRLNRSVNVHGNFDTAHDYALNLESKLEGHPTYTRLYAEASAGLASKKSENEKSFYYKKALELSDKVLTYSGASDLDLLYSELVRNNVLKSSRDLIKNNPPRFYSMRKRDIPRSYVVVASRVLSEDSQEALPYDNINFNILKFTANSQKWSDEKLIKYLESRYIGHPEREVYLANRMIADNQDEKAIDILQKAIKNDRSNWKAYIQLGDLLIGQSKYTEADEMYSTYEGFSGKIDANRVYLANRAYHAGNEFYWHGRHEETKKYYKLAGNLNTGSASGYASLQRIAMMDQDYDSAMEYALRRGKRYNNKYGYRDYLVMMHLLGAHSEAYSGFSNLVERYKSPQLWTSLFVGQRIQAKEKVNNEQFVNKYFTSSTTDILKTQAARFVFLNKSIDRVPLKKDLSNFPAVDNIPDIPYMPLAYIDNMLKKIAVESGVASYGDCKNNTNNCIEYKNTEFKKSVSQHTYNKYENYLDSYIKFRSGLYKEAFVSYLENDLQDLVLKDEVSYDSNGALKKRLSANSTLPYIAMSALKNNYAKFLQKLDKTIAEYEISDDSKFDILLTQSIISAQSGDIDKSLELLMSAFSRRPHTKWRPLFSWYQITEISESLYHYTNDKRFLDLALNWAKRYQVIQPQFSWAYAFEALYSENQQDRIRASGFALYLDRDSYWLSMVPDEIKKLGKEWWKKNNPFVINEQKDNVTI